MKFASLENFIEVPTSIIEMASQTIGASPIVNGLATRVNNIAERVFGPMDRTIEEAGG